MRSHEHHSETDRLSRLVEHLQDPSRFHHSIEEFETVETHISIVLLTGPFAYKLKKPLDLDFLDFSTLERRRKACEAELQLNRRTAPDLYRDVISITDSVDDPKPDGDGQAIEYAVKMKQFPASARLDRMVLRGEISDENIDHIADRLADVHDRADLVWTDRARTRPAHIREEMEHTYQQFLDVLETMDPPADPVNEVWNWLQQQIHTHRQPIIRRTEQGFVRDLHGDLHLENIAWMNGRAVFFDCIEFNASYRRIDVMNELAFPAMDLERMDEHERSWRLVNRYLEYTGDYEGVVLLPMFKAYRAMVRAMVAGMKSLEEASEKPCPQPSSTMEQFRSEMSVPMNRRPPRLILMHGLSGSGKTTVSQQLIQRMGGIRIRSDVERKRLFDVEPYGDRPVSDVPDDDLYSDDASRRTYDRLKTLAETLLDTGYPVFVDATFLQKNRRRSFLERAEQQGIPVCILHLDVPDTELRERVRARGGEETISDADEEVLEDQLAQRDPLTSEEYKHTITVDASNDISYASLVSRLNEMLSTDT